MSSKNTERISFASRKIQIDYPDFLEVQLKSFGEFFQLGTTPENRKREGLFKVFTENFPITDTRNNFVLEFLDYYIDPPRYTIEECIERGLTFSVPLKAKLKLYCTDPEHEDFDTVIQDVYLGTVPYMTERGTFVINGAERVVVSQLHRSPGVFFGSIVAHGLFFGVAYGSRSAIFMGMTNPAVAATQFTAFMGMSNLAISMGNYWQGIVAERMGYAHALYLDALIAALVIGLIPFLRGRAESAVPRPARLAECQILEAR